MAVADTARLIASLELDPRKFNAGVGSALGKMGALERGVGRMGKGFGQVGAGLARVGVIAGTAVAGGLVAAAKVGADFEAQLNTINTIARETPEGLEAIGDGIRQIARDTGKPLDELTQGYYDLLSAGIDAADAQNVLTQANTLAIGGLASTAETVDLLTTAINVYGGDASQAADFTDDFATAIERGKVTAADLAASYANVAPLAKSLGIENAELAAGYATLTAAGTSAGEASTQMASAMTALLKTTPGLEALQKATGKNYAALAGSKGLNVALEAMRVDAKAAGIELIDLVGRKEALLYILQTTGPNLKAYNADLAAMGTNAGTAAAQMAERQKGLTFEVGRLKANLKDAALELSAGFLPALSRSASELSKFLDTAANRTQLRAIGEEIGEAIDSIDWGRVLDGAKAFWEIFKQTAVVAKTIFDTINLLPTEIKAAGLGLIGLNKLSGGLIGTGLGNIVGGLGETITRALGSKLPGALGKAFVQPVLVTNWPPGMGLGGGGVAGAAKGGLSTLSKVFLVGEAIGLAVLVKEVADNVATAAHEQSVGIHQVLTQSLATPQTEEQLAQKLSGINEGINNIQNLGNIPAGIFHETLVELETMRDETVKALEALAKEEHKNLQPLPDDISKKQQKHFDRLRERTEANRIAIKTLETTTATKTEQVRAAEQMTRDRVEANRIAVQTGTAVARSNTDRIVAAIQAAITTVVVNVSTSSGTNHYQSNYLNSNKPKAPMI